ncbi:TonB family protein [Pedobacter sp. L105]|uniref:TonB family protein n=1 Tax=Pedobacter sp. L105 TaxID=1641871 RepID=UPI00131EC89A|nr:TonB family protein [Pedobacter sp. L105]
MTWAYYLLQVNIYLVIFYAFYKLLLDRETYFILNRVYLIASGILSLAIPFLRPEWFVKHAQSPQIRISVDQLNMIMSRVTIADEAEQFNWGHLVAGIYILGTVFFALRFILRLRDVRRMIKMKPEGVAFSFFRKKVIDSQLPGLETIDKHEDLHVRQFHTLDVLFYELMAILVWCNPIIYLYKVTVKNIHEYLADEEAALYQGDKESYALLLLSRAFGIDQNVLTNTFYHKSLIKKRIFMLNKQRSRKTAILKYGLFLPLFAVTLLLSSATIRKNEEIKAVAEKIASPLQLTDLVASNGNTVYHQNQTDGWSNFYKHISNTVQYPALARYHKLQGNSIIQFTVRNGQVSGLGEVSALGQGCEAQVMKAILDFDDFKHIADGKYSLKVAFRLNDSKAPIVNAADSSPKGYTALKEIHVSSNVSTALAEDEKNKVYDFTGITIQPGFPGGMDKFYLYLSKNCKYPKEAQNNNVQGKVFLSFIVEEDGKLSNIKVEKGLGSGTDEEALRLMQESPKWTPGYDGNVPVRVKYNIPIHFTLSVDVPKKTENMINQKPSGNPEINRIGTTDSQTQKAYAAVLDTKSTSEFNASSALWVINGVVVDRSKLGTVDPALIESMTILKGENAMNNYGNDGKNGVVEIKLRKERVIYKDPVINGDVIKN